MKGEGANGLTSSTQTHGGTLTIPRVSRHFVLGSLCATLRLIPAYCRKVLSSSRHSHPPIRWPTSCLQAPPFPTARRRRKRKRWWSKESKGAMRGSGGCGGEKGGGCWRGK